MNEPQFLTTDPRQPAVECDDVKRTAPTTRAFNHLIAGAHFERRFHRWPLSPHHPEATINDFIFARMIDPDWSALQRAFVDKETAKSEALARSPGLRVAKTLSIIAMETVRSLDHLHEILRPFIGTASIAKPAHASGAVTFMHDVADPEDLRFLYELASLDYAVILREMQYLGLPRKIIVESMIPSSTGSPPDDYKFHCVHGQPLVCQVGQHRFGPTWSRLFDVPTFAPMHPGDGLAQPQDYRLPTADRLAAMLTAGRRLAAPFDFVRVDLYDGADGVYFGELTFTPAASLGIAPAADGDHAVNETHRIYSEIMMSALAKEPNRSAA